MHCAHQPELWCVGRTCRSSFPRQHRRHFEKACGMGHFAKGRFGPFPLVIRKLRAHHADIAVVGWSSGSVGLHEKGEKLPIGLQPAMKLRGIGVPLIRRKGAQAGLLVDCIKARLRCPGERVGLDNMRLKPGLFEFVLEMPDRAGRDVEGRDVEATACEFQRFVPSAAARNEDAARGKRTGIQPHKEGRSEERRVGKECRL